MAKTPESKQPEPAENANGKTYEAQIYKVRGRRIYVQFKEPITIDHPQGPHPVPRIVLDYDVVAGKHPQWALEHPYDPENLVGITIPISRKTLYAVVDKHYKSEAKKAAKPSPAHPAKRTPEGDSVEEIDKELGNLDLEGILREAKKKE
jgi:hypothetical protein